MGTPPENNDRAHRVLGVAAGIGLVAVGIIGGAVGQSQLANALTGPAQQALATQNINDVTVAMTGREATLSGGTSADQDAAKRAVEAVYGVRWANFTGGTSATEEPSASASPAQLDVRKDGQLYTVTATVASEDEKTKLQDALTNAFGSNVQTNITVDPSVGPASWLDKIGATLGTALAPLTTGDMTFNGDEINLTGTVAADADLQSATDKVKDIFSGANVNLTPGATTTEAPTPTPEPTAPTGASAEDLAAIQAAKVLFTPDSPVLQSSDTATLDQIVSILQKDAGISLNLVGHSGIQTGTDAEEQAFSASRAQAVADYLTSHGIDASRLQVSGVGIANPTADITTEAGQAANRCVTFTITKGN